MAGEYIVAAIREEIKSRIPENWDTYHSPSCNFILCARDCPSTIYRTTHIWRLWTQWVDIYDRQDRLQRQQNDIRLTNTRLLTNIE